MLTHSEYGASLRVESGVDLPGFPAARIAVDVHTPDFRSLRSPPVVLVCLPGGGMNRRYYDLMPPDGDNSFSFARQMSARGFIVVTMDHLGVGDSDRPEDGYLLTPELLTRANTQATEVVLKRLREGSLVPGIPRLPHLLSLGVGHSMGAMMTVLQQARARQHAGIMLLGFSTRGLPEYMPPEVRELARDSAAVRARLPELAKKMFVEPYPVIKASPQANQIYAGGNADPRAVEALKVARGPLLPVPAFMSMLPANVGPEAAEIDVPLFLGLGERDMAGPTHQIPAAFGKSRDVTLHIVREAGHSHFLFPGRDGLFERLSLWARAVVAFAT
ncbi:MAG TPA: alpha/beta hydrolase [Ramlibacter sp.]|nr:alpha/beta hydrolase [Ramlibacter sp.]